MARGKSSKMVLWGWWKKEIHNSNMSGSQGVVELQAFRGSDKMKRRCRADKVLNNQTHTRTFLRAKAQIFILLFLLFLCSTLFFFCSAFPPWCLPAVYLDVFHLPSVPCLPSKPSLVFPPPFFLEFSFSLLCFFPTAYIPQQNLSSIIKVTM